MRKLLFIKQFTKSRKERIVNSIIGIISIMSIVVGIYFLYGTVSSWYFLPFVIAFLFDNLYYTEDE